jgi:SAM-dependent methyltransferase
MDAMMNGWEASAQAWIDSMGEHGDRGRQFVLDPAMTPLLRAGGFKKALDVGCGEGRLCRLMSGMGIATTGLDPTPSMLKFARNAHPDGKYVEAAAEAIPFEDASFDLVVSCLSLIDIADYRSAISEMVRVLEPDGTLMIANLTSLATAGTGPSLGWQKDGEGNKIHFAVNNYSDERAGWEAWSGIRILNHHRPLSAYMGEFLCHGLVLKHFGEPQSVGASLEMAEYYRQIPWFLVMMWKKGRG